jgi:hypothetical protein
LRRDIPINASFQESKTQMPRQRRSFTPVSKYGSIRYSAPLHVSAARMRSGKYESCVTTLSQNPNAAWNNFL